jgi:hypothetical protein
MVGEALLLYLSCGTTSDDDEEGREGRRPLFSTPVSDHG